MDGSRVDRMSVGPVRTAFLILLPLAAVSCVHQRTVQDFGLNHPVSNRSASAPNASVRAIFQQQQPNGVLNGSSDDVRIQSLQNRLKTNAADTAARSELGAVYETYRLYDEALQQYTALFDLTRSEASILGIARCDQALNRTWQAIPLLEQFLKESPSVTVWSALARMYDLSGNLTAGENALREAVRIDPASDQSHNNLGYNLLLQGKLDAAEPEFRKALELSFKSVTAHNNLGMLLARRDDLQGALEQFQFSTDAATAHNNLAVVLMEIGKYEQSRDELVKALSLRRNFEPALSNFKLVQERMRSKAEQPKVGRLPQTNLRVASAEQEASQLQESEGR